MAEKIDNLPTSNIKVGHKNDESKVKKTWWRHKSGYKKENTLMNRRTPLILQEEPMAKKIDNLPPSNLKVYHINYESKVKKSSYCSDISYNILLSIPLLFLALYFSTKCISLDISEVENRLYGKLHGQGDAIQRISETLQNEDNNKIMFFYGGTGVGKTYAASLIFDGTWNSANVYHFTMPSFKDKFSSSSVHSMGICKSAFIVVDDLTEDLDINSHINEIVTKSIDVKANLTIVLIYNCDKMDSGFTKSCDESFKTKLEQSFSNIQAHKVFIKFERLNKKHLRKCMDATVGKKISDDQFEDLSRNFDVTSDGCKGVTSKMKFLSVKV